MISSYSRTSSDPILVDTEFFTALHRICEASHAPLAKDTADYLDVSEDVVKGLVAANTAIVLDDAKKSRILDWVKMTWPPKLSVTYSDGLTFKTSEIDEIEKSIARHPGLPTTLSMSMGSGRDFSLSVEVSKTVYLAPVVFRISGREQDITHILSLIEKLIRNSLPVNTWLYRGWPWWLMHATLAVSSFFSLWATIAHHRPLMLSIAPYVDFLFPASAFCLIFFWGFVASRCRRLFPNVQFSASRSYRHLSATTVSIGWFAGALGFPLMFAVFPTLFPAADTSVPPSLATANKGATSAPPAR